MLNGFICDKINPLKTWLKMKNVQVEWILLHGTVLVVYKILLQIILQLQKNNWQLFFLLSSTIFHSFCSFIRYQNKNPHQSWWISISLFSCFRQFQPNQNPINHPLETSLSADPSERNPIWYLRIITSNYADISYKVPGSFTPSVLTCVVLYWPQFTDDWTS